MQRVVVDENPDRPLRRQQVGRMPDRLLQSPRSVAGGIPSSGGLGGR
jgi:hypothetical protein